MTPPRYLQKGGRGMLGVCGGHLAGEPVVAGGAAAFLHFGGWGEAGLGGHSSVHGHVGDAGCGHAGRVGGSDEELVQVGQSHQEMLPRCRLPIRPLPVLLQAEGGGVKEVGDTSQLGRHQGQKPPARSYLPENDLEGLGCAWGQVGLVGHQRDVIALWIQGGGVRGVLVVSPGATPCPSPGSPIP